MCDKDDDNGKFGWWSADNGDDALSRINNKSLGSLKTATACSTVLHLTAICNKTVGDSIVMW